MKQIEADIIKAAARLHTAVMGQGAHSLEAQIAIGEIVAAVDKVVNAKEKCAICQGAGFRTVGNNADQHEEVCFACAN